jgi:hypothetical protein
MGRINLVPPSREPLRGFLRMRKFFNVICDRPHAEERPKGASRSTRDANAAGPTIVEVRLETFGWILV